MRQDLRYALRMMAAQPLFTVMARSRWHWGLGQHRDLQFHGRHSAARAAGSLAPSRWWCSTGAARTTRRWSTALNGANFRDPKTGYTSGNFPYAAYELAPREQPGLSSLFAFKDAGRLNALTRGRADFTNRRRARPCGTIRAWSTIEDSSTSAFDPAIFSPLSSCCAEPASSRANDTLLGPFWLRPSTVSSHSKWHCEDVNR